MPELGLRPALGKGSQQVPGRMMRPTCWQWPWLLSEGLRLYVPVPCEPIARSGNRWPHSKRAKHPFRSVEVGTRRFHCKGKGG